jgi:hypothetical protein
MSLAVELEVDRVMHGAFAVHPCADACVTQQPDGSLFEHACADPVLDVLAASVLEDDALDSCDLEQAGEREARRPRADDRDLRALPFQPPSSSRTRWKTWNALFAAGTPQ